MALNRGKAATSLIRGFRQPIQTTMRNAGGIKILEESNKAKEALYWHQEDEKLLKKMIENNPDLNPEFAGVAGIAGDASCSITEKVKLVFMKHGIPPVNKSLISDIV